MQTPPTKHKNMAPTNMVFFCFFFSSLSPLTTAQSCRPTSCPGEKLQIRFPFGLTRGCSYPKFTLSCNSQNKTTLNLPNSAQFLVQNINYTSQRITIKDTEDSCILGRFLNGSLNLAGTTPFNTNTGLSFYNCSSQDVNSTNFGSRVKIVPCLSGRNYTIAVTPFESDYLGNTCELVKVAYVPFRWWNYPDRNEEFSLEWNTPDCTSCERRGGTCRFRNRHTREIRCFGSSVKGGLPRSAEYGIIIGIGVPVLLCLIGFCSRITAYARGRRNREPELSESQLAAVNKTPGLDKLVIESYPKTLLGESRRLPNPNDSTCPICLADYEPKDALRSIPDCRHYFHVECIDEWLEINTTCPLCRNSPGAASVSFSSSASTVFSSSSSSLVSPVTTV